VGEHQREDAIQSYADQDGDQNSHTYAHGNAGRSHSDSHGNAHGNAGGSHSDSHGNTHPDAERDAVQRHGCAVDPYGTHGGGSEL
jgi:hypothetical protein